ncbi:MAG: hypothetical protein AB8B50_19640 [Pirellulaceae bacterium]
MQSSLSVLWIRSLTKGDLHLLIADVKRGDRDAIERAVEFVCAESFGIWHNRARAKLCRHFKNHPTTDVETSRMVEAIVSRLVGGQFSEQFKDQLCMAVRLAPARMNEATHVASSSERAYVRRYADWIRNALSRSQSPEIDK